MPFSIEWVLQRTENINTQRLATPIGGLWVRSCGDIITDISWEQSPADRSECADGVDAIAAAIMSYWTEPSTIVPVRLLRQGTEFQRKVWSELVTIPFGQTKTYKALAVGVGSAARAIGGACRSNRFPLLVPCHRVVSMSGAGGYAGQTQGALMAIKLKLLDYERTFEP